MPLFKISAGPYNGYATAPSAADAWSLFVVDRDELSKHPNKYQRAVTLVDEVPVDPPPAPPAKKKPAKKKLKKKESPDASDSN